MSDTAVKVLATMAGLAGLGFAGAAFVGAGAHKPNPSSEDEKGDTFDASAFMESAELRRNPEHFRALFAQYAAEHGLAEPIAPWLGCGGFGCAWRTTAPRVVLKATKDERKFAILWIEHKVDAVLDFCDRVGVLDYGVKIADDCPDDVACNPGVIEAYLGEPIT